MIISTSSVSVLEISPQKERGKNLERKPKDTLARSRRRCRRLEAGRRRRRISSAASIIRNNSCCSGGPFRDGGGARRPSRRIERAVGFGSRLPSLQQPAASVRSTTERRRAGVLAQCSVKPALGMQSKCGSLYAD